MQMIWRIAQKKLLLLNQLMKRGISNIAKQVVYEELLTGTKDLPMNVAKFVRKLEFRK